MPCREEIARIARTHPGHTHPAQALPSCTLPGAAQMSTDTLGSEPEKFTLIQILSCPGPAPWSWGLPALHSLWFHRDRWRNCFQVTVPKRELIPVHLKWEKLRRVRCQRHFSNFLESTGLLESSNCCYLKSIKREFIIAQPKNSLTFLVSHILNFRKGLRKPQEPLPSSWRFQCGSAGGRAEVRCVKSNGKDPSL